MIAYAPAAADMTVEKEGYFTVVQHFNAVLVVVMPVKNSPDIRILFDQCVEFGAIQAVIGPNRLNSKQDIAKTSWQINYLKQSTYPICGKFVSV